MRKIKVFPCLKDLPPLGTQLVPGRPFAMLEAPGGKIITLESPVTGEVVKVNDALVDSPELASKGVVVPGGSRVRGGGVDDDGWIAKVDPWLNSGDPEPEFAAMWPIAADP